MLAAITFSPAPATADGGVQLGARSGVQLVDDDAAFVGAEARLSFELSPLVVDLTVDHFFVDDATLLQIGANALYDLPIAASGFHPYAGAGVSLTRFEVPEMAGTVDSNGMRIGLSLVGGIRFEHEDLPVLRPFAQVVATFGPIDLFTIGGGVLFELGGG